MKCEDGITARAPLPTTAHSDGPLPVRLDEDNGESLLTSVRKAMPNSRNSIRDGARVGAVVLGVIGIVIAIAVVFGNTPESPLLGRLTLGGAYVASFALFGAAGGAFLGFVIEIIVFFAKLSALGSHSDTDD